MLKVGFDSVRFALLAAGLGLLSGATADDGALSWSGAPKLLHGKTHVRMVSEKVNVEVKKGDAKGSVSVDCTFVFQNEGAACDVRIGFPDRGSGADETQYGEYWDEHKQKGQHIDPYTGLEHFKSWVDGKEVSTKLVDARRRDEYASSWHEKVVHFDAHQRHVIRDSYSQSLGGGMTATQYNGSTNIGISEAMYQIDTGASWSGNIGHAEVSVKLPFEVKKASKIGGSAAAYAYKKWNKFAAGEVGYGGFARPAASGRTLRFTRDNFKPTKASDVHVYWPSPASGGA